MADDIIILSDIKEYRDIQTLANKIEKLRDRDSRVKEPVGFLSMPKITARCKAMIADSSDTSSTETRQRKIMQFLTKQISLYQSYLNKLRAPKTTRTNPPEPAIEGYDKSLFMVAGTELKKYIGKGGQVEIPFGITIIGSSAFKDCKTLAGIVMPNSVIRIGNSAFSGCTNLVSINVPNTVETIGQFAFEECVNLSSINLPDSIKSIGGNAFDGCTNITIYCKATKKPIGWARNWIPNDSSVIWGDKMPVIQSPYDEVCPSYSHLPSLQEEVKDIYPLIPGSERAIYNSIKPISKYSIYINKEIIYKNEFDGQEWLFEVILGPKVRQIEENAFFSCKRLIRVIISKNVQVIKANAFAYCPAYTKIYCEAKQQPYGWDVCWNPNHCKVIFGYSSNETDAQYLGDTAKKPITPVIDGFDAEKVINDDTECTQKKREKAKVFNELKKLNLYGDGSSQICTLDDLKNLYEQYRNARKIITALTTYAVNHGKDKEIKKAESIGLNEADAAFLTQKILWPFDSLCDEEEPKYPLHTNGCTKVQYIKNFLKSEDAIISKVHSFCRYLENNRSVITELINKLKEYTINVSKISRDLMNIENPKKTDEVERSKEERSNLIKIAKQKQNEYNQAYEILEIFNSTIAWLTTSYQTCKELIGKIESATTKLSISLHDELDANKLNSSDENMIQNILEKHKIKPIKEGRWAYASFEYYTTEELNKYIDEIDKPIKQVTDYNNNFNYNRVKSLIDKLNKYISCLEEYYKEIIEHERQKAIAMTEKDLIEEDKRKLEEEVIKLNALSKKLWILFGILLGVALVSLVFTFLFGWLWDIYWGYILFETILCISCIGYLVILIICWRLNKKIKKCEAEILENKQKIQELNAN